MTKKRVKFSTILNNQLPSYVREEFPLVAEFLKQYYISQEFQGAPTDLIQNIDQYIKLDEIKNKSESVSLSQDISFDDDVINITSEVGTFGFPDYYGLIKIDNEIITYTSKTSSSFVGCIRGFSGVSSYATEDYSDELVFESTESSSHSAGATVTNLNSLFLKEFLNKIKYQLIPGFEGRTLDENLDQYLFLKQSKDFYSTKGTDTSFKILFKALYGENVDIIKPQNYLIRPSDAGYKVTNDLVVESIEGNPYELVNSTLFQDEYGTITKGFASIAYVEKVYSLDQKEYYKLSFDSGYNKDINVDGSLYGNFSVHPKTKVIGDVEPASTTIDVDSTIGFPSSGELMVIYEDTTTGIISYSSKSLNQFFGCTNISKKILDTTSISLNVYAYGKSNKLDSTDIIKVRINSVLKDVDISDNLYYQYTGDRGIIKTLGVSPEDLISNNWIFNLSVGYEVKSISLIDSVNKIYRLTTYSSHNLRVGDFVDIIDNTSNKNRLSVIEVTSDTEFSVGRQVELSESLSYKVERVLHKVNHSLYSDISNQNANVQNIYKIKENTLVACPSLPYYNNQPLNASDRSVVFSGTFFGDTFQITFEKDHGFYTGDCVYYQPSGESDSLLEEGIYFVKRIDSNKIKFAKSSSDIHNSKFISVDESVSVVSDKILLQEFKSRTLKSQKLLREIKPPVNDGNEYPSNPGPIGILINGTEILNYKAKDKIYYGSIENIEVTSGGVDYDVIDAPTLDIIDSVGFGATGYCAVSGSLSQIRLIDSGFDYISTPSIRITGGNGIGAKAFPVMRSVSHEVSFNSEQKFAQVNTSNNTIGFTTYHKFRNAERIIYITDNQQGVGGISTNAEYYANVKNSSTISIHKSYNDAIVGINSVSLTSFGVGSHTFKSFNKKLCISSINIVNSGTGYENKKRTTTIAGINTSINTIEVKNHGFNSGEIVKYFTDGYPVEGLFNNTNYYLTKVDENRFKLSEIGNQLPITNLVKYSEKLDDTSNWARTEISSVESNVEIAPDGTKTADLVIASTVNSTHALSTESVQGNILQLGETFTLSVFVKKYGSYRYFQISGAGSQAANEAPVFDLNTGTVINPPTSLVFKGSKIEYYGNGWYRCSAVYKSTIYNNIGLQIKDSVTYTGTTFSGDGTSGFYMWGAQVEKGSNLSPYVKTLDTSVTKDIVDDKFNYLNKKYLNLTSLGLGTHTFNYPEISVEIVGSTGIEDPIVSSKAVIQPIFRGQITSFHLQDGGKSYGSSEILNYYREPLLVLREGRDSELVPIVNNGKIVEVLINNSGKDYNSSPDIRVIGDGIGAVLSPIVENGQIKEVKILNGGFGYTQSNTSLAASSSGVGAKFNANLQTWTVNLVERYLNSITSDDGFIFYNSYTKSDLQYSHLYAPRKLRESVYSVNSLGKPLYGTFDLSKVDDRESSSTKHSPIIGWAYDGNPIYGPYGYTRKNAEGGGSISQMKSGYKLNTIISENRPLTTIYPLGFFVEDYTYNTSENDVVLDQNNGRFCVTPEFPNGVYAYFSTVDTIVSTIGSFKNYKAPTFPYFIGNNFKSHPNDFNFKVTSNQDDIDLNQTKWIRNTKYYNLLDKNSSYKYLNLPNNLNQTVDIKYASSGNIETVGIITGGNNYKINDLVISDDNGTGGYGFSAKVSLLKGKEIDSISLENVVSYNVEIYPDSGRKGIFNVISDSPHSFITGDIVNISGFNTSLSIFNTFYYAGITTNTISLKNPSGIANTTVTGIVTYISVGGNLSNIRENDIYSINSEKIKVLNVDKNSSRIRVLRAVNNTVGSSHSYSDILYENPRKLFINSGLDIPFVYKPNKEIYFNPEESVGIGTSIGLGIGTTAFFSSPGVGATYVFIPTKSIYLPNHGLETGDEVLYFNNGGNSIGISTDGKGTGSLIQNQSPIYIAKVSNDFIGISTVKVGLGSTGVFVGIASTNRNMSTLYLMSYGTGVYHSFKTNYNSLKANISKNKVTVSTAETHGLLDNDSVIVDVRPSISTSYTITYNDYHRKLLVNPRTFSAVGVNTVTNTISVPSHRFTTGQQVIHTTSSIVLPNNKDYYVVVVDDDTIKLSDTYYDSVQINPPIVGIPSAFSGTLSPVNPPITVYKGTTIIFDLSDPSLSYTESDTTYSAFNFNLYLDSNFTNSFESSKNGRIFEVKRFGSVGITSNARLSLTINENIPEKLFYKLDPIYNGLIPSVKSEISTDFLVQGHNELQINQSLYNGEHSIISISSTSFTYSLKKKPESNFYNKTNAILEYQTKSANVYGSVSKIEIVSSGQNYSCPPKFTKISSEIGSGALLEYSSKNIGNVKKLKVNDIGFDYPCDFTIKPNLSLPQVLKIRPLSSFESIQITSIGNGYSYPAKLVVLDGLTRKIVPEVDLQYSLGDSQVTILKNTFGINNVSPIILPTQNSNGVGISSIVYDSVTKDVTVTLSVGFSTADIFPFEVNDRVLIENISVGLNSTGLGFNSKNYNYELFTLTGVSENLGGIGIVTYSLNNILSEGQEPGLFDEFNSSGRIIPEKYFPKFNSILKKNNYITDEKVRYLGENETLGSVEGWDSKNDYLRVSSRKNLIEGKLIQGETSKTQGLISNVISEDSFINLSPYSKFENGWQRETGFIGNNLQRVQDSFYYQNFSYSLKSKVSYDDWENAVGSLNHTLGFKKFSDYQCEPPLSDVLDNSLFAGASAGVSTSIVDTSTDIVGVADLNCFYDFDLARENVLVDDSYIFSNEIIFSSKILTDYFESVSNRVLSVDDFSDSFYNLPRTTRYAVVHKFDTNDVQSQKYITFVKDRRYFGQRQLMLVTLVHDNNVGYLNQYGRVETAYDLGSFDFTIQNVNEGSLLFYPNKSLWNDYDVTTLTYNIKDTFVGIATTSFGNIVYIDSKVNNVSSGTTTIVGVGTTITSVKAIVEISADNGQYQFSEFNLVHNGSEVEFISYGPLVTDSSDSNPLLELGEFNSYISGSNLIVDFTPSAGIAVTINSIQISIANTESSGIGTFYLEYSKIEARSTEISSSPTPVSTVISEYEDVYNGSYFIVQISDKTNQKYQISEVIVVNDLTDSYISEYAILQTDSDIGNITSLKTANTTQLLFTPNPNIDVELKVYSNAMRDYRDASKEMSFNDETIVNDYQTYYGAAVDIKRTFDLNHRNLPIFKRFFDGSSSAVIDVDKDTIIVENHFFVTGEKLLYSSGELGEVNSPIGITTTDFGVGIGTTDKLPSSVYVVKLDQNKIKLASSAQNALKFVPETLNLVSVGVGTNHNFTAINQNSKGVFTIDNVIQSPIVSTATTTHLVTQNLKSEDILYVNNFTNIFSGDLIKVDEEIMRVESVGVGSTNAIRVNRPWLGTTLAEHLSSSNVIKLNGDYNIVENKIHFVTAPYGKVPFGTPTNPPDEIDWENINTNSTFYGRIFMRSGPINGSNETYYKNYIFDDISNQFNGTSNSFVLKSNFQDVSDISQENAIILINDVFQNPGINASYVLEEGNVGITSIKFIGTATSLAPDINTSNLPAGGIIVSVGSTAGFGYQPLVSAGGTAIVSTAGTISAISIGNSGSGYRQKISNFYGTKDVTVRVGVATSSTDMVSIEFIGTAAVSNGNIVSIAITNPGIGYTSSNPPFVIFDSPLSYSDIPLIYSSSNSGIGTQATIDIVVGQGSSVIDFEIRNLGYGYRPGDVLTVPTNSIVGIPTVQNSIFKEFQVEIQRTFTDKFVGWSIGELQPLDSIDRFFDSKRVTFTLRYQGQIISILSAKGSNIVIRDNLLIFLNDILQVPGESYVFDGGSSIKFNEAPKPGDVCKILFYKGSGEIDVPFRNILETVKVGDEIQLTYDSSIGQNQSLLENPRTVLDIKSIDLTETNPYFGPGNTADDDLERPLVWCKQTEDKIINQKEIGKDRMLYEASIYPSTYLINSVGIGSTIVFVDSLRPFFNQINENITSLEFQKNIYIISQDNLVGASATAVVSTAGTISSIVVTDGGYGYDSTPKVTIQNPIGIGTTRSTSQAYVSSGIVTSIQVVGVVTGYSQLTPPLVLIDPPVLKIESNKIESYSGDFGVITGIATTSVGLASTGIIFEFMIPPNSPLRDISITGFTTVSGIKSDYYFVITDSNVGNGVTSLSKNGGIVGIATIFLDGVYQAIDVSIEQSSVIGVGTTYVAKVTTSVSSFNGLTGIGISNYFGNFSWGRVLMSQRQKENNYNAYTLNGITGISTGSILRRTNSLRYSEYKNP